MCQSEPLLCLVDASGFHGFAGLFDSAFEHAFHPLVLEGFGGGDAHVFLGGFLDRHKTYVRVSDGNYLLNGSFPFIPPIPSFGKTQGKMIHWKQFRWRVVGACFYDFYRSPCMIARLEGRLFSVEDGYAIVMTGGVGYKVFVSSYALGQLAGRDTAELFIHTYIREDTLALYGFISQDELRMFELLIGVSGIGPKAALGILSIADPVAIRTAVLQSDTSILTKVSGVGKKTAERVVLELRNKVGKIAEGQQSEVMVGSEALDALIALGYSVAEAREALKVVPADVTEVGARVKQALQNLGRKR